MIIDDIKETIVEKSNQLWGQIQENPSYTNIKEKYEGLSPMGQKASLFGTVVVLLLLVMSIPMAYYSSASNNVEQFETKKGLIRELFHLQHATSELPPLPLGVTSSDLVSQAKAKLDGARLQADQIKLVQAYDHALPGVTKPIIQNAVEVSLLKLNLTQIKEIGVSLQNLPNVKMISLDVEASEPALPGLHYFNAIYRLTNFSLPAEAIVPPPKNGAKKK